jgi:PIN domain nuclease of toxin-antitoxin system
VKALVLDTHAALWWSFLPGKLSGAARRSLDEAERLLIPGIVFWDAALLVRKRRIELPVTLDAWLNGLQSSERWRVVPLDAETAIEADGLQMHEDPADRFIVATALRCKAPLLRRIARYARRSWCQWCGKKTHRSEAASASDDRTDERWDPSSGTNTGR